MKSQGLQSVPASALALRKKLVGELLNSPEKYGLVGARYNWKRELRLMLHSQQMPCLEVLLAASYVYQLKIFVYFWCTDPIVFLDSRMKGANTTIHIQCVGGIHFNPLKEVTEQRAATQEAATQGLEVYTVRLAPEQRGARQSSDPEITSYHCATCGTSTHPRIKVELAGQQVCGILDTGAEVSLIRKSVVEKCQAEQGLRYGMDHHIHIEGFSGLMGKAEGTVNIQPQLPSNFTSFDHSFCVVSDCLIPHCMLLGID